MPNPPRRSYGPRPTGPGSKDLRDRIHHFRSVRASVIVGFAGCAFGFYAGLPPWLVPVMGVAAGYAAHRWILPFGAVAIMGFLEPSGASTPPPRNLSIGESAVAQGRYDDAIRFYTDALSDQPDDPEPAVRLARLHRDQLQQYDDAISWFRRARSIGVPPAREEMVTREIIDILDKHLDQPLRAIPEFARLADRFADTELGTWAKTELAARRARQEEAERDE